VRVVLAFPCVSKNKRRTEATNRSIAVLTDVGLTTSALSWLFSLSLLLLWNNIFVDPRCTWMTHSLKSEPVLAGNPLPL
jgi:hypothetical protein